MSKDLRYGTLAGFALLAALAACDRPNDPQRLEGASLRNALRGATFEAVEPPHDAPTHYRFACDGRWGAWGGQVDIDGRYLVSHDRYCIERFQTESYCFAVFRGQGSTHYIATIREDAHIGYREEFRRHGRMLPCGVGKD